MLGRVTIVGCGLIGGSLVKCLRERTAAQRISAIDRDEVLVLARPYVDDGATPGSARAAELVAASDLVVLATPVGTIARDLAGVLDRTRSGAVVTDTGSVKKCVIDAATSHVNRSRFVAGHPMAGRASGGFEASSPNLFEQAPWFIVAPCEPGAADRVRELAHIVGARSIDIEVDAHDRAMAYVSHVPQLVASALYAVAARAGAIEHAGTGFRDVTRIAGGPRVMWRDIIEANRGQIGAALADVLRPLIDLRDALSQEGEPGLVAALDLLEAAQAARTTTSLETPAREPAR